MEAWQNRPLAPMYAIIYLDALYVKLRRDGKVENVAVYNVLAVDLEGHKEILGHSRRTSGRCGSVMVQKGLISG